MSNEQYSNIGSDNGLVPTRQQAIIRTYDGKFTEAYLNHMASISWQLTVYNILLQANTTTFTIETFLMEVYHEAPDWTHCTQVPLVVLSRIKFSFSGNCFFLFLIEMLWDDIINGLRKYVPVDVLFKH